MSAIVHDQAARGDVEAFRRIASGHYGNAEKGFEPPIIALARAVEFARLAALASRERKDAVSLLYLLEQHSHALRDAGMDAQANLQQGLAFALAEHMGSEGDQELADMVLRGAEEVEPEVLLVARELSDVAVRTLTEMGVN